ncbi:site-specific integrase [Enterococcus songbeiensis]|uniref:site-specific integrase n=1 Tax=Enterococcus songbeiensis TaxID=2559927 RepID=UPI0010F786E4|nr:site-specific integrase [Enterococcus songbeiensis]
MNGHVRKIGNKWHYVIEMAKVNGKRQRIQKGGWNTKTEAQEHLRIAMNTYKDGGKVDIKEMSVSDYFDYWFENYVEKKLKYNTQKNYQNIINKYIKPEIGKYYLSSIGPARLQDLMNKLPNGFDRPLAKHTVEIVYTVLKGAFKRAIYPWQAINSNPMIYVEMPGFENQPKQTRDDMKIITMDQYQQILDTNPPSSPFRIPLMISFHTGLRRGEVCGLQWSDISLDEQTITVERIMLQDKNGLQLGTPKTQSSFRTIAIDDILVSELKSARKRQLENKLRYGKFYYDSNFVCTKENGEPVTPNSIKWHSSRVKKELGFDFNFHSLRHTHATMLLEDGVKPKVVQERLGHSRISTTMDKYVHVTRKMRTEAVDIFAQRLKKSSWN